MLVHTETKHPAFYFDFTVLSLACVVVMWPLLLFAYCCTQQCVLAMFLSSQLLYYDLYIILKQRLVSSGRWRCFGFTMMNLLHVSRCIFLARFLIA